jgi:tRNA pseudouridine32 synthase / 23S rRNA pseudouridine746 synthase
MIPVLFEDRNIVAVEKPIGLASIPERDSSKESVLTGMERQLSRKLYIVHRLDKDASGVLLFAKNSDTHAFLNEQFAGRTVDKTYAAVVHGLVAEEKRTIEAPLRQFGSGRMGVDVVQGKPSATAFEVVSRFDGLTLVHAHPITGRRHQIRVHCYHMGHPIAGDPLYGDRTLQRNYSRLLLHAIRIAFNTRTGKKITVESRLPAEFLAIASVKSPAFQPVN